MAKSARKKVKSVVSAKSSVKTKKSRTGSYRKETNKSEKIAEYTGCLLELHKLQGTLLAGLKKQI